MVIALLALIIMLPQKLGSIKNWAHKVCDSKVLTLLDVILFLIDVANQILKIQNLGIIYQKTFYVLQLINSHWLNAEQTYRGSFLSVSCGYASFMFWFYLFLLFVKQHKFSIGVLFLYWLPTFVVLICLLVTSTH